MFFFQFVCVLVPDSWPVYVKKKWREKSLVIGHFDLENIDNSKKSMNRNVISFILTTFRVLCFVLIVIFLLLFSLVAIFGYLINSKVHWLPSTHTHTTLKSFVLSTCAIHWCAQRYLNLWLYLSNIHVIDGYGEPNSIHSIELMRNPKNGFKHLMRMPMIVNLCFFIEISQFKRREMPRFCHIVVCFYSPSHFLMRYRFGHPFAWHGVCVKYISGDIYRSLSLSHIQCKSHWLWHICDNLLGVLIVLLTYWMDIRLQY